MKYSRVLAIAVSLLLAVSIIPFSYSQQPPGYIQPGLRFVYQLFDVQKKQPENAFHKYVIESASTQGIIISIESDIMNNARLSISPSGEFNPGNRIDLWISPDVNPGEKFSIMGTEAIVVQKGFDLGQGIKVTIVSSTDQSISWVYIDDGPQQLSQLRGLLFQIYFVKNNKLVGLVNIERAGPATTTSSFTTVKITAQRTTYTTQKTTVIRDETETLLETVESTVTSVVTITESTIVTTTVQSTATVTVEGRIEDQPLFPLPLAIGAAVAVIGIAAFIARSRKRPPPPVYPYPPPPPPPPQQHRAAPAQKFGYCQACRFPLYAVEAVSGRCGFKYG